MEQKIILQKIANINSELTSVLNILKSIGTWNMDLFPALYQSLTVEAALKTEKTSCSIRHLIYASAGIPKRELMKKVADVHGIDIKYDGGIFTATLPALLPKKKKAYNFEFITDPLHFALEEFFEAESAVKFEKCTVVFEHIYDFKTPSRRICDYDNIEVKPVLDTVSAFVMADDGGRFCDVFHTSGYAENDCTKISVMSKNTFPEWVKKR
jgi:hypothetical protein